MNPLIQLRRRLHQNAEVSGHETHTKRILKEALTPFSGECVDLAGGKAFLYILDSQKIGPNIVFRADMDALPIAETIDIAYGSTNPGVSHKCGHDGHMAMVVGLAKAWDATPKNQKKGKLLLLFQHAEETGEGALEIMQDPHFLNQSPTCIFGFHNIPEYPLGTLVLAKDIFACASQGLRLTWIGNSAHASEPEKATPIFSFMQALAGKVPDWISHPKDDRFSLATLVYLRLGNENYGITPGEGELAFTLRAKHDDVIANLRDNIVDYATHLSKKHTFNMSWEEKEKFPSTSVSLDLYARIKNNLTCPDIVTEEIAFPFLWSEDFGYYTQKLPGLYFGLGVGESYNLHHPQYNFNDQAIDVYAPLLTQMWTLAMETPAHV